MRIVADTNVVVSGLLWLGNPGRLLEAAANGSVTLYTSPTLVAELRSTLQYARLAPRVERSGLTLDELIARYTNVAIVVQPTTLPRIVAIPMMIMCSPARSPLKPSSSSRATKICSSSRASSRYLSLPRAEALRRIEAQR